MATALSPSSPSNNDETIPTATLAPNPTPLSRRLPPPCWSPDETTSLILSYQQKWYSLRRGNLRANHWQEVADDVALRTPVHPTKTAVQCRHKMEKLRKRYRSEIQRSAGLRRFVSTWPHFHLMDDMEKGGLNNHNNTSTNTNSNNNVVVVHNNNVNNNSYKNPTPPSSSDEEEGGGFRRGFGNVGNYGIGMPGVRIKIPVRDFYNTGYESRFGGNSVTGGYGAGAGSGSGSGTSKVRRVGNEIGRKRASGDGIGEMVESIRALGEGFMRMEKVKMDMARQVEEMRMEMELKRTEMILESQQRIVESFASAVSERAKKMSGAP